MTIFTTALLVSNTSNHCFVYFDAACEQAYIVILGALGHDSMQPLYIDGVCQAGLTTEGSRLQ